MTNGEIIEQLENAIELIKQDGKDWLDDRDIPILEACIKSLTALDKIRAEIEKLADADGYGDYQLGFSFGLMMAMEIIDRYKAESEIHCNCTDAEIAKSFIEDVEAVKDLLPQESDHKCHTCKHYISGEHDGSCGSYICKEYSNWESEGQE